MVLVKAGQLMVKKKRDIEIIYSKFPLLEMKNLMSRVGKGLGPGHMTNVIAIKLEPRSLDS